ACAASGFRAPPAGAPRARSSPPFCDERWLSPSGGARRCRARRPRRRPGAGDGAAPREPARAAPVRWLWFRAARLLHGRDRPARDRGPRRGSSFRVWTWQKANDGYRGEKGVSLDDDQLPLVVARSDVEPVGAGVRVDLAAQSDLAFDVDA